MNLVALRMLMGDRAKYFALVVGVTAASLLVTQQVAIFLGYMTRTWSFIDDTKVADVWVMNPEMEFTEDHKRMSDTVLTRVRGVPGVRWAVPMFKGQLDVRGDDGREQAGSLIGVDDASLAGGPAAMTQGRVEDLRGADSVIIDEREATTRFAHRAADGKTIVPLRIGDHLEINDHAVRVVGFCRITVPFFWQPVLYSTYSLAARVAPQERRTASFVLVKVADGADPAEVCRRIERATGQRALTAAGFRRLTATYVVKQTGIAINFGIAVLLGFLIGTAIASQSFYSFTLDNLRYFGALKAMGASDRQLLAMVLAQAAVVGAIGYGLGVGGAAIFGRFVAGGGLAFHLPWELLVANAGVVAIACALPAFLAIRKVFALEPAVVFRS